ncbi:glycosyltransferase family 25 protein [Aminobacter sp. MDW-2]|uniref:glycosyltransferase family 25 protein n=1 Tax=Aminobacter sp. MDW-2 TaxID=2666139 RepID=UPI00163C8E97|nr:glycosyltransferase family 25 protein [Aminobacter sp. MDW-2]QNH34548.1 glycosyltransferase family 25 protein [Aminobacter sp. MDW-2]
MHIPIFLINLDRSKDRLAAVTASAHEYGLQITRIAAADGRALDEQQLRTLDEPKFHEMCGKGVLLPELGCYISHLQALKQIAEGTAEMGVVLEDDVRFTPDFAPMLDRLSRVGGWDVVKLINHRTVGFVRHLKLTDTYSLGRCLHGSMGSAAAYVVRRDAARKLLVAMEKMSLPYDVELERAWIHKVDFFTLDNAVVRILYAESTIAGIGAYKRMKFPFYRRWRTLIHRTVNYLQCVAYAVSSSRLHVVARTEQADEGAEAVNAA